MGGMNFLTSFVILSRKLKAVHRKGVRACLIRDDYQMRNRNHTEDPIPPEPHKIKAALMGLSTDGLRDKEIKIGN